MTLASEPIQARPVRPHLMDTYLQMAVSDEGLFHFSHLLACGFVLRFFDILYKTWYVDSELCPRRFSSAGTKFGQLLYRTQYCQRRHELWQSLPGSTNFCRRKTERCIQLWKFRSSLPHFAYASASSLCWDFRSWVFEHIPSCL